MSIFNSSDNAPCYRCLFTEPPAADAIPNCSEAGVLGVLPGVVGMIQATEAVKIILGKGRTLEGRLGFSEFKLGKNPHCPLCGDNPTITELREEILLCPSQQKKSSENFDISPEDLQVKIDSGESFELIDVREEYEWDLCHIEGATLIPLSIFADIAGKLPKDKEIVLYCHHGMRSLTALNTLREKGFTKLKNLNGGIALWADEVDPDMPRY